MAYEYRSGHGLIRLVRVRRAWQVEMGGAQAGLWRSAQAAVSAIVRRSSGLAAVDELDDPGIPEDLLRWTPLADDL